MRFFPKSAFYVSKISRICKYLLHFCHRAREAVFTYDFGALATKDEVL